MAFGSHSTQPDERPDQERVRLARTLTVVHTDAAPPPTIGEAPVSVPDAPTIAGYRIVRQIAAGGMGQVYAAYDVVLDREVAIKTLLPGANPQRFVREAKITAQLPHPGIPPVHALGMLADGTPYLVMKLIRGRTMAEGLRQRTSPQDNLFDWLQVFEQIAQAVGFAHSRGIIHRDIKPQNVMVGEFGEVQVMDWGLAKQIDAPADEREEADGVTGPTTPLPAGIHTQAGAVMGTPGYMAPEQARGEHVDARADVFALGATLCEILTGKPAIVGRGVKDTVERSAAGDVSDALARLDACQADAELIALAKRCLASNPQDRPADGRQVAMEVAAYRAGVEARLRQAETERAEALVRAAEQRKRWRQFVTAAATVTLVLLIGLAVSLWQMNRARKAERLASSNAEMAMREAKAKEAALQAQTQATVAKRSALDRAMSVLRGVTDEALSRRLKGQDILDEDTKEYLRSILRQYEVLTEMIGDDEQSLAVRAESLLRVGSIRRQLGEFAEAEEAYRKAVSIQQQLAKAFPSRVELQQELAGTYNDLANLYVAQEQHALAETLYRDALNVRKQLAAQVPNDHFMRRDLAQSYNNLGLLLTTMGRRQAADAAYREAIALCRQLVEELPMEPVFRYELAQSYHYLGKLLLDTGQYGEAESLYREVVALRRRLIEEWPKHEQLRSLLASSYNNWGLTLAALQRPDDADAAYQQAIRLYDQLVSEYPGRAEFRFQWGIAYCNLANLLRNTGRWPEAESMYAKGIDLLRPLAAQWPQQVAYQHELARSLNSLGSLLGYAMRAEDKAQTFLYEAVSVYENLIQASPHRTEFRQELAATFYNLGVILSNMGNLPKAQRAYERALTMQQQLASQFPDRPEYRQDYARTYLNLGTLHFQTQEWDKAETAYRQSVAIQEDLVDQFPTHMGLHRELAVGYRNLAALLLSQNRLDDAADAYTKEARVWQELAEAVDAVPDFLGQAGRSLTDVANIACQCQNFSQARELLEQALPYYQAALQASPTHPVYREDFRSYWRVRTKSCAGAGEQEAAKQAADHLRDLGWEPPLDTYEAACALAECVPIVTNSEKIPNDQRAAMCEFFTTQAVQMLREAVAKGFADVDRLQADVRWDPVRQTESFSQLLNELQTRNIPRP